MTFQLARALYLHMTLLHVFVRFKLQLSLKMPICVNKILSSKLVVFCCTLVFTFNLVLITFSSSPPLIPLMRQFCKDFGLF